MCAKSPGSLQLRTIQKRGSHGHIGFYPIQTFKYYWIARQLADQARLAADQPPRTCEVGFGTGMSTALLATATSSPHSSLVGGAHHVFDCRNCMGHAGGKTPGWQYLKSVFGARLHYTEGPSDKTMPAFAKRMPAACDLISIGGAHTHPQVLRDIKNSHAMAHQRTELLFDDMQYEAVNRSVSKAVAERLIAIHEVFSAESETLDVHVLLQSRAHGHSVPKAVRTRKVSHRRPQNQLLAVSRGADPRCCAPCSAPR